MVDDLFSHLSTDDKAKQNKKKVFTGLNELLAKYQLKDKGGYITREFQDFGYRLALELNDLKRVSMYMRMAKTIERAILERALSFVKDAHHARSKARLFMWKVKQLRKENKEKNEKS